MTSRLYQTVDYRLSEVERISTEAHYRVLKLIKDHNENQQIQFQLNRLMRAYPVFITGILTVGARPISLLLGLCSTVVIDIAMTNVLTNDKSKDKCEDVKFVVDTGVTVLAGIIIGTGIYNFIY